MDEVHLRLSGELDIAAAPTLRRQLLAAAEEPREVRLVLDLRDVTLLDAAAMGALAAAAGRYGEVELRHCSSVTRRALTAAGMETVLRLP